MLLFTCPVRWQQIRFPGHDKVSDASPGASAMQGYTCVTATPCLGDRGGCTQRCVPLAATFCADICPNALDAVPPSGAAAGGNGMPFLLLGRTLFLGFLGFLFLVLWLN